MSLKAQGSLAKWRCKEEFWMLAMAGKVARGYLNGPEAMLPAPHSSTPAKGAKSYRLVAIYLAHSVGNLNRIGYRNRVLG